MIDLNPTKCNLCGGDVIFTSNADIYGREYGSGKCYLCTKCRAYVGTHEPRPDEALGILSDQGMRNLKKECHALFDPLWSGKARHRAYCYSWLAKKMGIPTSECHFGWFDTEQLLKAKAILQNATKEDR